MAAFILSYLSNAPFEAWKPYLLLVLAVKLTIIAMVLPKVSPFASFIPPYALTIWSLLSISPKTTAWSPPYLEYSLGITCIVNLIILPRILLFEKHNVVAAPKLDALPRSNSTGSLRETLSNATSIWNNPRNITTTKTYPGHKPSLALFRFMVVRLIRIGFLVCLHHTVIRRLSDPYFLEIGLDDVSPRRESLVRRLVWSSDEVTQFEAILRMLMPLNWIWINYLCLECYHDFLSILFVCILRVDDMDHWPPLFGSVKEAYTVKRFWGKFWHRVTAHNMATLARPTSRLLLRCKPGSRADKATIAFLIFVLSGAAHAVVAWRTAEGSEIRDIAFYVANFAAAAAEVSVSRAFWGSQFVQSLKKKRFFERSVVRILGRTAGFLWVYLWFVWLVPKWQFPKLHSQRTKQLKMEIALFFGDL